MSDRVYALLVGVLSGAIVGVVAVLTHRALYQGLPVGIAGVTLMLAAFAVFTRTICGRAGLFAGLVTIAGILLWFYMSTQDRIIVPDIFGLMLAVAVLVTGGVGLVAPQSRRSHESRNDLESGSTAGFSLESPRNDL